MRRMGCAQLSIGACSTKMLSAQIPDVTPVILFLTLPIPLLPKVEDVLDLSLAFDDDPELAGDPRYISFFFLTPGVASDVVFATLEHFEHKTMVVGSITVLWSCVLETSWPSLAD